MTGTSVPTIIFYTTIVFMQLIEYIVWTYGSDPEINFYASLGGAGLLMLQPIAVETLASPHPSTYTVNRVDHVSYNESVLSYY